MNAFQFYNLPVGFGIDKVQLRKNYIAKQMGNHPDLVKQGLDESSLANEFYQVLQNDFKRHMLALELLAPNENSKLDNMWLDEMMDLNEIIMEAKLDKAIEARAEAQLSQHEKATQSELIDLTERYDLEGDKTLLKEVNLCLQKAKYFERLRKIFDGVEEM